MIGKQQTKFTSRIIVHSVSRQVSEAIALFLLGALAMFVHARFRWGASMPGHHGLEFMAILMASRLNTRLKWSSVFMVLGIGTMIVLPFMGFHNPVTALGYLFPVIVLDACYLILPDKRKKIWLLSLIGGFAYMSVPIFRILLMALAGFPYTVSAKYGTALIPLAGFFVFGLLGSVFALGLNRSISKINVRRKNETSHEK
ncbi:MAG: hypothetical protein J7L96_06660 [Bacteroidales bacterium]|nr:hypothetical protein [Bacteroidales bacterium]